MKLMKYLMLLHLSVCTINIHAMHNEQKEEQRRLVVKRAKNEQRWLAARSAVERYWNAHEQEILRYRNAHEQASKEFERLNEQLDKEVEAIIAAHDLHPSTLEGRDLDSLD